VRCAEGFDDEPEYDFFSRAVLNPLREHGSLSSSLVAYRKNSWRWRLTTSAVRFGSVNYTVIATVPTYEVEAIRYDTSDVVFGTYFWVAFGLTFSTILYFIVHYLLFLGFRSIVSPVNDLRDVLKLVRNDNFTIMIPRYQATSKEMKELFEGVSKVTSSPLHSSRSSIIDPTTSLP
jgi:hypothetical protein